MKFVDLSLEISPNVSEPIPVEIDYVYHQEGADILGKPKGLTHKDFPSEMGLSLEHVKLSTHTGTHIDAPLHYGPISQGKQAKGISDLPLHWFFSDGVVLDCSDSSKGTLIQKEELQEELGRIKYCLKPLDIVLIKTNADILWGKKEYFTHFRGMSKEATQWLVEKGIKVIGIDTFGFDAPFDYMLAQYKRTLDKKHLWPAHFFGREKSYCQIERLANLNQLSKPYGFKVACFPIKIKDCGAGWSRVVAIFGDRDE